MRSGLRARQVEHDPTIWKTRQQFHKPSCFNFFLRSLMLLFDFSPVYFFDRTYQIDDWKQPFATVQENGCPVKLEDRPFHHNPRKIPVKVSIFNKFVNFLI